MPRCQIGQANINASHKYVYVFADVNWMRQNVHFIHVYWDINMCYDGLSSRSYNEMENFKIYKIHKRLQTNIKNIFLKVHKMRFMILMTRTLHSRSLSSHSFILLSRARLWVFICHLSRNLTLSTFQHFMEECIDKKKRTTSSHHL